MARRLCHIQCCEKSCSQICNFVIKEDDGKRKKVVRHLHHRVSSSLEFQKREPPCPHRILADFFLGIGWCGIIWGPELGLNVVSLIQDGNYPTVKNGCFSNVNYPAVPIIIPLLSSSRTCSYWADVCIFEDALVIVEYTNFKTRLQAKL